MKKRIARFILPAIFLSLALGANAQTTFNNPLNFNTVEGLLGNILGELQSIIAVLTIIFIVIGGLMYITAAGDSKRIETAKATITYALIGLAIAITAPSFLKELSFILGWDEGTQGEGRRISEIALDILKFLLGIVGIISIIMLVVGGIIYATSAGDEDRVDRGKNIVKYSIIGLIVALVSMAVVRQIATVLVS